MNVYEACMQRLELVFNEFDNISVSFSGGKDSGVLDADTINALKQAGVSIQVGGKSNYNTSKLPVKMSYIDDIDIKDFKLIPTYKRMCICIMKNDHLCKYMGFSQTKNEIARRKNIIEKYKNLL